METVGDKIESIRKSSKFSQNELANKLGMPQSNYSRLVNKGNDIPISFIYKIAEALDINPGILFIDDYEYINEKDTLLNEFSELTVIYWIHDYLKEILEMFKHDLSDDSLIIRELNQKKLLISILLNNVSYMIFSSNLSSNLEDILNNFFETKNVSIFYYSKKEKIIEVDINASREGRSYNRGFSKTHDEL